MPHPIRPPSLWTLFLLALALGVDLPAQGPQWIWGSWAEELGRPADEVAYLERAFDLPTPAVSATGAASADNRYVLYVNGSVGGQGFQWSNPDALDLAGHLRSGSNVISVRSQNEGGPAGFILDLTIRCEDGSVHRVTSDGAWTTAQTAPAGWPKTPLVGEPARVLGPLGMNPWGPVPLTALKRFTALEGFSVREVQAGAGSIIALALKDDRTLLLSIEGGSLVSVHDRDGDGDFETSQVFSTAVRNCQGILGTPTGAFAVGEGPGGQGLFELDQQGAVVRCLGRFSGGGEHGPHAVLEAPDGGLVILLGNHSQLLADPASDSPYQRPYEGDALRRIEDPRGHAHGVKSPGGTVWSVDREGKRWRLMAAGLRNAYDGGFDRSGELFVYDSDMEWDVGLPWYRPTRLYHVMAGADFGWRSGNGKWPSHRPDALPPVIEVGRGSPTGVVRYEGDRFPPRFRGMLLGADWSLGRIVAFQVRPEGRGYAGEVEVLVTGQPLNVTDLAVDSKGDVLFATGGRGTRGAVFRLRYEGPPELDAGPSLERLGVPDRSDHVAWLQRLDSDDRVTRYEAARWFEGQGEEFCRGWIQNTVKDAADRTTLFSRRDLAEACVVYQIVGPTDATWRGVTALASTALRSGRAGAAELAWLRVLQLAVGSDRERLQPVLQLVQGADPEASVGLLSDSDLLHPSLTAYLESRVPCEDRAVQREAAALLATFAPPTAGDRLWRALLAEPGRTEQLHLAACLHELPEVATSRELRQGFYRWLEDARRWPGGASFGGYLEVYQRRLRDHFDATDEVAVSRAPVAVVRPLPGGVGARREPSRVLSYVRNTRASPLRDRGAGAEVFQRSCGQCHRHGDFGGSRGPDLTDAGGRFSDDDLLSAIMEPSRHIPDRFRSVDVFCDSGVVSGMLLEDTAQGVTVLDAEGREVRVSRSEVDEVRASPTSAMPEGLLDAHTLVEIADLLEFLRQSQSPSSSPVPWVSLMGGDPLAAFSGADGLWKEEGGLIVGAAKGLPESSFLVLNEEVADFRLEVEVRVVQGNSGVQFRSQRLEPHTLAGYQADLGETWWGSLYEERGRGVLVKAADELYRPELELDGFNHLMVEAIGRKIRIELNGLATVIVEDDAASRGHIGFQLHAGAGTEVHLRGLRLQRWR